MHSSTANSARPSAKAALATVRLGFVLALKRRVNDAALSKQNEVMA